MLQRSILFCTRLLRWYETNGLHTTIDHNQIGPSDQGSENWLPWRVVFVICPVDLIYYSCKAFVRVRQEIISVSRQFLLTSHHVSIHQQFSLSSRRQRSPGARAQPCTSLAWKLRTGRKAGRQATAPPSSNSGIMRAKYWLFLGIAIRKLLLQLTRATLSLNYIFAFSISALHLRKLSWLYRIFACSAVGQRFLLSLLSIVGCFHRLFVNRATSLLIYHTRINSPERNREDSDINQTNVNTLAVLVWTQVRTKCANVYSHIHCTQHTRARTCTHAHIDTLLFNMVFMYVGLYIPRL